jgi:hypothetical protein
MLHPVTFLLTGLTIASILFWQVAPKEPDDTPSFLVGSFFLLLVLFWPVAAAIACVSLLGQCLKAILLKKG